MNLTFLLITYCAGIAVGAHRMWCFMKEKEHNR